MKYRNLPREAQAQHTQDHNQQRGIRNRILETLTQLLEHRSLPRDAQARLMAVQNQLLAALRKAKLVILMEDVIIIHLVIIVGVPETRLLEALKEVRLMIFMGNVITIHSETILDAPEAQLLEPQNLLQEAQNRLLKALKKVKPMILTGDVIIHLETVLGVPESQLPKALKEVKLMILMEIVMIIHLAAKLDVRGTQLLEPQNLPQEAQDRLLGAIKKVKHTTLTRNMMIIHLEITPNMLEIVDTNSLDPQTIRLQARIILQMTHLMTLAKVAKIAQSFQTLM